MTMSHGPMRSRAGFTLIELMIVTVLIAIMLAIAVPSFTSFISNYRATAAINDLLQGIVLTRGEALKRGRRVSMAPVGGDWRNGWTVFVDTANGNPPVYVAGQELIFQHDKLPASITISGSTAAAPFNGTNYIAFDGSGYARQVSPLGAALSGGIVVLDTTGPNSNRRTLCLVLSGRPRIVRNTVETCTSG